ncbi:MAG: YfhO family protein [Anaerolineae bacterium]|nr:YfhO family protein [Anaerolineae bacterium]
MKNTLLKITVILLILLLTLLFFWKILLTNLILVGVDPFLYFYPYKTYTAETLRQGRLPLWNPYLFMGAPLLANSQVGVFYPLNWLFLGLDPPKQVAWSIGLHIALAGLFMLAYARFSRRLHRLSALVAAIGFALGGYLGAQVEHINQLNAAAWLPLIFLLYDFGTERKRQKRWFWFLLLALVVALTLLAGHAQTVFISLFGLGLYALWRGVSEEANRQGSKVVNNKLRFMFHVLGATFTRYLWPLVVVVVLATGLAASQLLPTAELSSLSIRSHGLTFREAVAFSVPPSTLHYTLLPPLSLDLSQIWGETFGERVAYVGVSGLILTLLGALHSIWQREARRFVFIAACGLILSLGMYTGPFYLILYYLVPGFNLFRVPARWLLLYGFGVAVLAGYGCNTLLNPAMLGNHLTLTWRWLCLRSWRLILFFGLPLIFLLALVIWKTPPLITLVIWSVLALITLGLVYYVLRHPPNANRMIPMVILLLLFELFWASQSLNYNQPTAPQAYHSLRNAVAFLRSVATATTPPDRFLSLSGITYDPGDLRELEQIYADSLSSKAFYNLIVATKQKEVLAFNLPLLYGLPSVDGYDGGILPLTQFVALQQLFLPPDQLSLDGRLRENLRFVPPGRLLSLLNARWIITDKVFDAWIDGIFYDLQFPAYLSLGQTITTTDIPDFPATAIGLVSQLDGAAHLPVGTAVAELTLTFANGPAETFTLDAGVDTAEGYYSPDAAHPQAAIGAAWPYDAGGVDYITILPVSNRQPLTGISLTATLPAGQFVLKGLSLIHQPTNTSRSIILSTEGNYRQVHSGDVKIYENRDVLPRAFIVHQVEIVADEAQAVTTMRNPNFDPRQTLVRLAQASEATGLITAGQVSPNDTATIVSYAPERVEITVTVDSPGWLVLTDANYPGWQVTMDGQPAEIMTVNIMFRGVELSRGEHTVVFEFKPRSLLIGLGVSGMALLVLAGGLVITGKR